MNNEDTHSRRHNAPEEKVKTLRFASLMPGNHAAAALTADAILSTIRSCRMSSMLLSPLFAFVARAFCCLVQWTVSLFSLAIALANYYFHAWTPTGGIGKWLPSPV